MSTSDNFTLATLISRRAAAVTPLFEKMQRVAEDRQIELPVSEFPYSLLVPPKGTVNALVVGGSSLNKRFPPATDVRPEGVRMFLTDTGDVVVDNISVPRVVERLSDTRVTYIAGTFTTADLKNILRTLDDIHAQLHDFQMAYGHWTPIQWIVDHLGTKTNAY